MNYLKVAPSVPDAAPGLLSASSHRRHNTRENAVNYDRASVTGIDDRAVNSNGTPDVNRTRRARALLRAATRIKRDDAVPPKLRSARVIPLSNATDLDRTNVATRRITPTHVRCVTKFTADDENL